ncbi:MAG: hypothetical protein ACTS3F_03545 [Phycisphaerales bacterium]
MKTGIALAAGAVLSLGAFANASVLSVSFDGTGKGSNVRLSHPDIDGGEMNVFAGQLFHTISGGAGEWEFLNGTQLTFCSEVLRQTQNGPTKYEPVAIGNLPSGGPESSVISAAKSSALNALFDAHYTEVADAGIVNRKATAFQLLVWEIILDFDGVTLGSLDVSTGTLAATKTNGDPLSSNLIDDFNNYRDSIFNDANDGNVVGIVGAAAQNQLVYVPAPGVATLIACAGLAAVRRRRSA